MAYRKKTLRTMSPTARKVARLTGELDSVSRRLKNLIPDLQRLDFESNALKSAKLQYPPKVDTVTCPDCWIDYTGHLKHGDICPECKGTIP